MTYVLIALLAVAFAIALRSLYKQNKRLAGLRDAIRSGRPYLEEDARAASHSAWRSLVDAGNALLGETAALRQRSSDQLAQLEATLGNLREAVMIVDNANYIHLANRALREVFPAARNLSNLRLELIFRSVPFQQYVAAVRAGEPLARQEFELTETDGTRWIEASGAQISAPDGKSQWALFVIHDITHQRKLERMRRDFVANASHELRTPLSVIKGYIETLIDGHDEMPPADRDRFLKTIQRHSDRLNAIIQDLLVLSRLESTTPGVQIETVDVDGLLSATVDEYSRRVANGGYEFSADISGAIGTIEADPAKITQVLDNLFENALKHTPRGTRIELTAGRTGDELVEFAVRDNGPGIPSADLPHIFDRFYRVEKGRSRETGGTGLGLSIVKHIVQLHGGRVWAESEQGRGTAIVFQLPRHPPTRGDSRQMKFI